MNYDNFITHKIDYYMGKPKSGKTLIAASYPRPLLYVSVGNDGGGRVILTKYRDDVSKGLIKVKNLKNDEPLNGKIATTSCEKLALLLRELRQPDADKFKTIVIDTVGALQDDYQQSLVYNKKGTALSMPEWGDVGRMVLNLKDNMKRFSEETDTQFVWISHTREYEVYETSGLNKEIRIIPDLTITTGNKFLKDASNVFYCCRKSVINPDHSKTVKFLTYVGPHPLMDTGTRDLLLGSGQGNFVEDFNYQKWEEILSSGTLPGANLALTEEEKEENKENVKEIQ